MTHKTEIGGVRLGVAPGEVEAVCGEIAAAAAAAGHDSEGFLVQERVSGGIEMVVGFARDALLGPAVLVGAGGSLAELYRDSAVRLLPVSRDEVRDAIAGLRIAPLLGGYRGTPPADVDALVDAVLSFAAMCEVLGDRLVEAEVNPLFVLQAGDGVKAADGVAVLAG